LASFHKIIVKSENVLRLS